MQIELKPCPFCGDTPKEIVDATRVLGVHRIVHRCAVIPPFLLEAGTPEAVAAQWNRRATEAAAQSDYERRILSALAEPAGEAEPSKWTIPGSSYAGSSTPPDASAIRGVHKFELGDRVTKIKGSKWTGHVVGFYSTALTPVGYAVESETETGSVQIYPEAALAGAKP